MLPKHTRELLDKHLPHGYPAKVLKRLKRTYHPKHIYQVRGGTRYTEEIALALVAVAKAEKARKLRIRRKLSNA